MILFHKRDVVIILLAIVFAGVLIALYSGNTHSVPAKSESMTIVLREKVVGEFCATGYSLGKPYDTITRSGSLVINRGAIQICGVNFFTIAVDPTVIPLGSLVFIDSLGLAMATDTGRAIKGMKIDVCFTNINEATKWGKHTVAVTMIRSGP